MPFSNPKTHSIQEALPHHQDNANHISWVLPFVISDDIHPIPTLMSLHPKKALLISGRAPEFLYDVSM